MTAYSVSVLFIVALAVVVIAGGAYLLYKSGRGSGGYMPIVCVPDPAGQFATAGGSMTWSVTGKASSSPDTLTIAFAPAGSASTPQTQIPVPAGTGTTASPISFTVTFPANATGTTTVTASTTSGQASSSVTVVPVVSNNQPDTPTAAPGANLGWQVTLDQPAPSGGQAVALSSPTPTEISVPATVVVPAGATSVAFSTTLSNTASGTLSVVASCNGSSATGSVLVQ